MQEPREAAIATNEMFVGGRILIVDDDPIVAGMLGISLQAAGHEVFEVNSGEEALAKLAEMGSELLPDIVFLDIEMGMGIDGYETCRRLRIAQATYDLPVIFLSGHDELDDRLRAYDAGGSDFIAKPFVPDEVLRKALISIRHKRRQDTAMAENLATIDTTMTALTALGESGVTLKFSRGSLGCSTPSALAALTINSLSAFGIDCHVQIRTPGQTLTITPQGPASPLEESVIDRSKEMGRLFSFGNRLIVNYDSVSLLVTNMPVMDDNLCGRIRDEAAVIAETAELAVANINLRTDAVKRAEELRKLADFSRQAIEELRSSQRQLHAATRLEFETMANTIEGMYVHLGLTNRQEFTISDTVRGAVDKVLTLVEGNSDLDRRFAAIVDALSTVGEYAVKQEEEAPLSVELW
jgi:DNA-binding response OmpR family regulator